MDIAVWVLLIPAAILLCLYGAFRGAAWLAAELSGWHKLQASLACQPDAGVWTHKRETVRVNSMRFRRCAKVGIGAGAFHLQVSAIFTFKALRIPWDQMTVIQPDEIYRRPAMRLLVQGVNIAVTMPLYAEMYPYLAKAPAVAR